MKLYQLLSERSKDFPLTKAPSSYTHLKGKSYVIVGLGLQEIPEGYEDGNVSEKNKK